MEVRPSLIHFTRPENCSLRKGEEKKSPPNAQTRNYQHNIYQENQAKEKVIQHQTHNFHPGSTTIPMYWVKNKLNMFYNQMFPSATI